MFLHLYLNEICAPKCLYFHKRCMLKYIHNQMKVYAEMYEYICPNLMDSSVILTLFSPFTSYGTSKTFVDCV